MTDEYLSLLRHYAAMRDAVEFAHGEGFEWPVDPYGELALTFADIDGALTQLDASVGRSGNRQDTEEWLDPKGEHAVTPKAADAQDD